MHTLKKNGIEFAFVGQRFADFDEARRMVENLVRQFRDSPLVLVFPENLLDVHVVHRSRTKDWIRSISPILDAHGNAHVFFSVYETGIEHRLSNTGYIVSPRRLEKKTPPYQSYPKLNMPTGDQFVIERRPFGEKVRKNWIRRSRRLGEPLQKRPTGPIPDFRFDFPAIRIASPEKPAGNRVELRVCADVWHQNRTPADLIIVPADGLSKENLHPENRALHASLTPQGMVLCNDVNGADQETWCVQRNKKPKKIFRPPERANPFFLSRFARALRRVYGAASISRKKRRP